VIQFQMSTKELMDLWPQLIDFAWEEAGRYTRIYESKEEYVADALVRIGRCQSGGTIAYYRNEIHKGIHAAWKKRSRYRGKIGEKEITLEYLETMDRQTYESWRQGFYAR